MRLIDELPLEKEFTQYEKIDHCFLGIFDPRSNAGVLHEHIRDEYDHNESDNETNYGSGCWNATGVYSSSNAKHYGGLRGGPIDFLLQRL